LIEAKIVLLMFIWTTGQGDDKPLWTSDAHLTVESCEENAVMLKAKIIAEHGTDSRMEHHCVHLDDRFGK
jgi:hypothetical protein